MTIANIREQMHAFGQSVYSKVVDTTSYCGKAYSVFSKDADNKEVVLTFTKAAVAFIEAKEVFGFGKPNQTEVALRDKVTYLDGWNSIMTFPEELKKAALKVFEVYSNFSFASAVDTVEVLTGLVNSAYEVKSFSGDQLFIPAMTESTNFQFLLTGAIARIIIAAERVIGYCMGKEVDFTAAVNNAFDLTKNAADFAFAVLKLTNGTELAVACASSVSAASKVAKYCFSKAA